MFDEIFTTIRSQKVDLTTANENYLIPAYPIPNRKLLIIFNESDYNIYVGGSDVETTTGLSVKAGDYIILSLSNYVYVVSGNAAQTIRIMELS